MELTYANEKWGRMTGRNNGKHGKRNKSGAHLLVKRPWFPKLHPLRKMETNGLNQGLKF